MRRDLTVLQRLRRQPGQTFDKVQVFVAKGVGSNSKKGRSWARGDTQHPGVWVKVQIARPRTQLFQINNVARPLEQIDWRVNALPVDTRQAGGGNPGGPRVPRCQNRAKRRVDPRRQCRQQSLQRGIGVVGARIGFKTFKQRAGAAQHAGFAITEQLQL